jgi:hypothetical protein
MQTAPLSPLECQRLFIKKELQESSLAGKMSALGRFGGGAD